MAIKNDSTEPPVFSWHLDEDGESVSHVTTLSSPTIRVKSPSSASLSVKSIQEPAVLSDHHYAESSPNLQRPDANRFSSYSASIAETAESTETEEAQNGKGQVNHHRVVFLVCYFLILEELNTLFR